jgi:hypothetical protein
VNSVIDTFRVRRGRPPAIAKRICAIVSAATLMCVVAAPSSLAHVGEDHGAAHAAAPLSIGGLFDLARAMSATAKYHDVERALADGYVRAGDCVRSAAGVMGQHYINPTLASDSHVDSEHPELLLYVDGPSRPRLVGLEYYEAEMGQPLPTIFGRPLDGPMAGHEPGAPEHNDLHVWVWAFHPSGIFAQYNPRLSC